MVTFVIVAAFLCSLCACGSTSKNAENVEKESAEVDATTNTSTPMPESELAENRGEAENGEETSFSEVGEKFSLQMPVYAESQWYMKYDDSKASDELSFDNFALDDAGRLISYDQIVKERKSYGITNEYDEQGNVKKSFWEAAKGSLNNKTYEYENEYDENGCLIKVTRIEKEDGEDDKIIYYTYDENGLLTSKSGKGGSFLYEYQYEYNESGMVQKESSIRDGLLRQDEEYQYDDVGRVSKSIETDYDKEGNISSVYETDIEYDPYGHALFGDVKETFDIQGDKSHAIRKFSYVVAGYKTLNSEDDATLNPASKWVSFNENKELPTPDSVVPALCTQAGESTNGVYEFILDAGEKDPLGYDYFDRGYSDVLANTIQKTPNEAFWKYTGVLSQLLGFEVNELDEGRFIISKDGFPVAEILYGAKEGNYCLTVTLK